MADRPASVANLGVLRAFVAAAAHTDIGDHLDEIFDPDELYDLELIDDPDDPLDDDTVLDDTSGEREHTVADLYDPANWHLLDGKAPGAQPDNLVFPPERTASGTGWMIRLGPNFSPQAASLHAEILLDAQGNPRTVEFELD
jgi:hypothetical protein